MSRLALWLVLVALPICATSAEPVVKLVSKRSVLTDFGSCVARTAREMTEHFLNAEPGSEEERRIGRMLVLGRDGCVRGDVLSLSLDDLKAIMAQAKIGETPALLDHLRTLPAVAPTRLPNGLQSVAFINAYAACVAKASPDRTAAVLKTPPASAEERTEIVGFGDTLADCMPTDINYHMNIADFRAHLALAVYRATLEVQSGA